jgi:hypothetical protein
MAIHPLPADRQILPRPLADVDPAPAKFYLDRDPMLASVPEMPMHCHLGAMGSPKFPTNRVSFRPKRQVLPHAVVPLVRISIAYQGSNHIAKPPAQ